MTDPDTILAHQNRIARDTTPDSIEDAVLEHIESEAGPLPPAADGLALPPTDGEVFDGVPTALPEEITEKVVRKNDNDDRWDDEITTVRAVVRIRPTDPTGCMM
jgi:hypothetical protein